MAPPKKLPKSTSKDVNKLIKAARKANWEISHTGGTHIKLVPPDKEKGMVVVSTTTRSSRAVKNARSELRKRGLKI